MNFQYILIISLFFTGLNSLAAAAAEQRLVTRRNSCPLLSGSLSAAAQSEDVKEDQSDWPTQNYRRSRFTAYLQEDMEKQFNELQGNSSLLLPDVRGINSRQQLEQQAKKIQGFRSSKISADLAEEAINSAPKKVRKIVTNIKRGVFENHEKNVVLYGFPGTGKTTLAKAVAQACDIPCLLVAAGRLSTEYANSGSVHLREMFKLAKEYGQPCIIAIDELEVLIKKQNEKHGHENSILTTLWQEMDEVQDEEHKIAVIFTLNSKKDLPAAMEDRITEISVPLPTLKQRERSLAYHLKKREKARGVKYEEGITAINLARKTHDFSQRDLGKLLLLATDRALESDGGLVTNKDFLIAIKEINNNEARKEARAVGTWSFEAKKYCQKNALPIAGTAISVAGLAMNVYFHKKQMEQSSAGLAQNAELSTKGMVLTLNCHEAQMELSRAGLEMSRQSLVLSQQQAVVATQGLDISRQQLNISKDGSKWQKAGTGISLFGGMIGVYNFCSSETGGKAIVAAGKAGVVAMQNSCSVQ